MCCFRTNVGRLLLLRRRRSVLQRLKPYKRINVCGVTHVIEGEQMSGHRGNGQDLTNVISSVRQAGFVTDKHNVYRCSLFSPLCSASIDVTLRCCCPLRREGGRKEGRLLLILPASNQVQLPELRPLSRRGRYPTGFVTGYARLSSSNDQTNFPPSTSS